MAVPPVCSEGMGWSERLHTNVSCSTLDAISPRVACCCLLTLRLASLWATVPTSGLAWPSRLRWACGSQTASSLSGMPPRMEGVGPHTA
eukprot:1492690-Rhodomonas_salina.2